MSYENILIVHTPTLGHRYALYIAKEINLAGKKPFLANAITVDEVLKKNNLTAKNTIVHFRTANLVANARARDLEKSGFRVVNSAAVLERTSDKYLSCEWAVSRGVELPESFKGTDEQIVEKLKTDAHKEWVIKPINSIDQGKYCYRLELSEDVEKVIRSVPGRQKILQEFINYLRIYRVIVIGGKALGEAVFMDEPNDDRWKVSVCVNQEIKYVQDPDLELLTYAEKLAEVFETEVGFIDVFETKEGYVLSEINTACSLILHERISSCNISKAIAMYLLSL